MKFAMLTVIIVMHLRSYFFLYCVLTALAVPLLPFVVHAADFSFAPVLIDEKAKPRDILKQSLTITNTSNRKLNIYPSVNNINPDDGEQGFSSAQNGADRAASLANWIELSRGVIELGPGEEKTIPFVTRVNLTAVPGIYHAYISFYEGSTREAAEQSTALGKVTVNVEVQADVKEVMQLNTFFSDNLFFSGDDVLFSYQLENIGNQSLQPKGEIRVYDSKGKEVASVAVNAEGKTISPDEMSQIASVWTAASGFGRYKAFINVDYGQSQKASVQDTVFFWIIPWQQLVGMLAASLTAVIFLALYFHRRFDARYHAHLAHAGIHAHPTAAPSILHTPRPSLSKGLFSALRRMRGALEKKSAPTPAPRRPRSDLFEALGSKRMQPETVHPVVKSPHGLKPIDLKQLHSHQQAKPHSSHVINLKDTP